MKISAPFFLTAILIILFYAFHSFAEEDPFQLEPIVVTATRSPVSKYDTNRKIMIINRRQIDEFPADSLTGLLRYAAPIDVRRRGVDESTADASIRGAGFEETLILLNGIPLNDPQTGHHNLDVPLTNLDIERIEIMPGSSSSLYGSAASGGVVNIITRPPKDKGAKVSFAYGEHQFRKAGMGINFPFQDLTNRLSFEAIKSGGWRHNTEIDQRKINLYSVIGEKGEFYLGYVEKDFGANGFYALSYPDQQEETKTLLSTLQGRIEKFDHTFYPKLFYRRHADRYVLDETRSSWYLNQHTSYSYGGELSTERKFANFDYLLGISVVEDEVTSIRLGDHDRNHEAVFVQAKARVLKDKVLLGVGMREDHYSGWNWEGSPSANIGYYLTDWLKLRASASRSFRVPSFTDLYYSSSTSVGNPDLTPEKSWSYEAGLDTTGKYAGLGVTVFRRKGRDIIDWARSSSSDPWRAENIEDITTDGFEIEWDGGRLDFLKLNYTYLDADRVRSTQSRYMLDYLKHQLAISLHFEYPKSLRHNFRISYQERVEDSPYWVCDARIAYSFRQAEVFLEASNLFNKTYYEQGDLPMPGRWLRLGCEYEF